MKNVITAVALILVSSVASAANLPEKKVTPTAPIPAVTAPESWYVGVNAGGNVRSNQNVQNTPGTAGFVVGYKVNPYFAYEATLDQAFKKNDTREQTRGMINGIVSPFGSVYGFTPYALGGIGTQTHDIRDGRNAAKAVYNVGGGVKYAISTNWEADARYRYVNTLNNTNRDANIFTLGLNYKF